jgi:threonine aldolase
VETNIVVVGFRDAPRLCSELEREGVLMGALGPDRVRAVTHLDVDAANITTAIAAVKRAIDQAS